jgi:hypothetical protein
LTQGQGGFALIFAAEALNVGRHLATQTNFINLKKHKTLIDQARRSGNFAA